MRLLTRIDGTLTLIERQSEPYAILSHTWGPGEDEVLFDDIGLIFASSDSSDAALATDLTRAKAGYTKIHGCLDQAERDGFRHVWIDTCCINRERSSELDEAFRSMYQWFAQAAVCYVYLSDVLERDQLEMSRWFTRSWTLQELIAPRHVQFFTQDWKPLGDRMMLHDAIFAATRIDVSKPVQDTPILQRFLWALSRTCRQPEDVAYSLLGLLEVSIQANYGEGTEEAMARLFAAVSQKYGTSTGTDLRMAWTQRNVQLTAASSSMDLTSTKHERELLRSLHFDGMDDTPTATVSPIPGTCTWLLENATYQQWMKAHSPPCLWIKGRPGSGKSTLMRFAAEHLSASRPVMSYFFSARGHNLQRSAVGLYRTLLYQLLKSARVPLLYFVQYMQVTCTDQIYTRSGWTDAMLMDALRAAIALLDSPVYCFIDAIDECPFKQIADMVQFFKTSRTTTSQSASLADTIRSFTFAKITKFTSNGSHSIHRTYRPA